MTNPASPQPDAARSIDPLSLPLSVVSVIVGSLSRWLFLTGEAGRIHADEAVSGLMARSLLDGDWSTFFWGQHYGGSIELLWLSPAMALVGDAALVVIPIVEAIVLCILVWRYCSHFVSKSDAVLAASLVWATPALWQWFSLRPMLFYQSTLIIGFSVLLLLRPGRTSYNFPLIGLFLGLGWWTSPQVLFFAIPALLGARTVIVRGRGILQLGAGFCLGAAPWIATNFATGFASIRSQPPRSGSLIDNLSSQISTGWPMTFGLRTPFNEEWIWEPLRLLSFPLIALFVLAVVIAYRAHRVSIAGAIGVIPTFIIMQALAPTGSFVGTGRYYVFVIPSIAIVIVAATSGHSSEKTGARAFAVTAMLALSLLGTTSSRDQRMEPTGVSGLAAALVSQGHTHIRADYWSAYLIAWYEPDLVVAANHTDRRPDWAQQVSAAPKVAEVFWLGIDYEQQRFDELLASDAQILSSSKWNDWAIVVVVQQS